MKSQPYKGKIVFYHDNLDYGQKLEIARRYGYNVNSLPSRHFVFDAGRYDRGAMSDDQYGALFRGDEAYAGSKNFLKILDRVKDIFGKGYVVPTHLERGAEHLLFKAYVEEAGKLHWHNPTPTLRILARQFKTEITEDADIVYINEDDIPTLRELLEKYRGKLKVVNASRIFSNTARAKLEGKLSGNLKDLLKEITAGADIMILSATEDLFSHVGALVITDDPEIYRRFQMWVVSFEGLHTYGGLAGRDMEVIATGLEEALREDYWQWRFQEMEGLHRRIRDLGYKVSPYNARGFAVDMENPYGFNLALFLSGAVRGWAEDDRLLIQPGKRAYMREHIDHFVKVMEYLKDETLPTLKPAVKVENNRPEALLFEIEGKLKRYREIAYRGFPYRFKGVELLIHRDKDYRRKAIEEAGYNTFLLKSEDIYIDLLTDSGTSAQSDEQFATAIRSDFRDAYGMLKEAVEEIFGFPYFVPTHQGRQAEFMISQALIKPGQYVINNMYFTTTRFHQEYAGGIFVDMIIPEAHDPSSEHPFKGNIDTERLEEFIKEHGPEKIAYVVLEFDVNMAGGQPASMENIRKLREICDRYGIPFVFDATRLAENAYFIKTREPGYENKSLKEIIREMMSYGDAASISAKKDPLTNISGLLLIRDRKIYERIRDFMTAFDGDPYSGGLADRDLAILAKGLYEMTNFDQIHSRISQVHYLGRRLDEAGIPLVKPFGGHAIYIDAKKFLPHIPQDEFPAQVLAAEIYVEGGVRTMERGTVSAGRDPKTGENRKPKLELVRITIPRRVYTNEHMDQVVDAVVGVWNRRESLKGLEFVYEAPFLRFFTSRFRIKE